ncbi:hypothetical protein [Pseudogemmobacter sonorensis]|uniref:hypothetical protein n=1 Tax=Pseudogemmobacter sonorensis TaxID=2989681 RepID=UPI0036A99E9D
MGFNRLALVAFPFSAFAQGNDDIQAYMGIADPTARLACFDGLIADDTDTDAAAAPAAPWIFEVASDTLTGGTPLARNTAARMEPETMQATEMNIRCMDGRVEGYLVWGGPCCRRGSL